jgi:phosphate starvation-inducible PhoH-like protein
MEQGLIEVAPLAFMRGRTLSRSFVILDEAQNTTIDQMKMFLTRLGQQSRAVVAGDVSQVDLLPRVPSGLSHALSILDGIPGIAVVRFGKQDVRRHALVQRILAAYDHAREVERGPAQGRRENHVRSRGEEA